MFLVPERMSPITAFDLPRCRLATDRLGSSWMCQHPACLGPRLKPLIMELLNVLDRRATQAFLRSSWKKDGVRRRGRRAAGRFPPRKPNVFLHLEERDTSRSPL